MKKPSKSLIKSFENRLQEIKEDNIIDLSKNNSPIFNVVSGLNSEAFSTLVWDDTKPKFDYFLVYVTLRNNKLEGFICRLQSHLKTKSELTNIFALFICQRYKKKDLVEVFNTYQNQQRSMFEQLDYWTYDNSLTKILKGKNATVILKDVKGPLYIPYLNSKSSVDEKTIKKSNQITKSKKQNFVYIMLNQRNGFYKIGRSVNPEYREKTLQAEEPEIDLIKKWPAPKAIEKKLHNKYKKKKVRGEWFELTKDDVNEINNLMESIMKN